MKIKVKTNIYLFIALTAIILTAVPPAAFAQETVRIMTYNILEYPNSVSGGDTTTRNPYFRTIMKNTNPDILVAQEISSKTKADDFLNAVMNSFGETYVMRGFITNSSDVNDNNALYYKKSKFDIIDSSLVINSGNHPVFRLKLYHKATRDTLTIFNSHFSSTGETQRTTEANAIRTITDALPGGSYFIDMGDHNILGGGKSSFQALLNQSSSGYFIDPQNLSSELDWSKNSLTEYNTFATRKGDWFGKGSGDGLDERFDLLLVSQTVNDSGGITLEPNTYTEYGNDGLHNNIDINANGSTGDTNQVVSQAVADALYYASDHLPVYGDFYFGSPAPGSIVFTQVGADDPDVIEFITLVRMDLTKLKITNKEINSSGNLVNGNGTYDLSDTPWKDVPGGTFVRLGSNLTNDNDPSDRILKYDGSGTNSTVPNLSAGSAGDQLIAYTGSSSSPYFIAGITWGNDGWATLPGNSFAPGTSSDISLGSSNNYYFSGSVNGDADATRTAITNTSNWTSYSGHTYNDLTGSIGSGALPVELAFFTAKLSGNNVELRWRTETEVNNYGFEIEREAHLNPTGGRNNGEWETIGFVEGNGNSNSPKYYNYLDSDIGESGKYYYRLKQIDNDGTYEYSDITEVDVGTPDNFYLSQNYPNPFNPATKIDFTLPKKQIVTLRVYNILGEMVQEIINGEKPAGSYSVTFNASNLPSGVYIYRLETQDFAQNRKMTLLK